jgi:hypothetical protein
MHPQTLVKQAECKAFALSLAVNGVKRPAKSQGTIPQRRKFFWEILLLVMAVLAVLTSDVSAGDVGRELVLARGVICDEKSQLETFLATESRLVIPFGTDVQTEGCQITQEEFVVTLDPVPPSEYNDGSVKALIISISTSLWTKFVFVSFEVIEGNEI